MKAQNTLKRRIATAMFRNQCGTIPMHKCELLSDIAIRHYQSNLKRLGYTRTSSSYAHLAVVPREELEAYQTILLLAKSWTMVWGDKLSPESLAQFKAAEELILREAARKDTL